jgi:hypothetical protein
MSTTRKEGEKYGIWFSFHPFVKLRPTKDLSPGAVVIEYQVWYILVGEEGGVITSSWYPLAEPLKAGGGIAVGSKPTA